MKIESFLPRRRRRSALVAFAAACFSVWSVMFPATRAEAGSLVIPAWSFARGNAVIHADPNEYADAGPVVGGGEREPWGWRVEYDVEYPVAGMYRLHIQYASAEARPVEVYFDERNVGKCCTRIGFSQEGGDEPTWKSSGPRMVHYAADVQPVLDRNCVGCHSGPEPKGRLDLAGVPTAAYSRSYETLIGRSLISYMDCRYGRAHFRPEPPLTFGSHLSKLVAQIRKEPCKGNLSIEEFVKITTWIDANSPYYGTYDGEKDLQYKDEPNFRPNPLAAK